VALPEADFDLSACDKAVSIFAKKLLAYDAASETHERDRWHGGGWKFGKPLFEITIFCLARRQAQPPAIVVDQGGDMIWVIE